MPSSFALIPMSICTSQCLFSHSFNTYEWLNRDCDAQIYIGITSRWTGYKTYCIHPVKKFLFSAILPPPQCSLRGPIGENSLQTQTMLHNCLWQVVLGYFETKEAYIITMGHGTPKYTSRWNNTLMWGLTYCAFLHFAWHYLNNWYIKMT
jgi:hypothetical protein